MIFEWIFWSYIIIITSFRHFSTPSTTHLRLRIEGHAHCYSTDFELLSCILNICPYNLIGSLLMSNNWLNSQNLEVFFTKEACCIDFSAKSMIPLPYKFGSSLPWSCKFFPLIFSPANKLFPALQVCEGGNILPEIGLG